MSKTNKIENVETTIERYDNLIRRLKVLSKSQTALLKAYLHGKLSAGANLVSKAIEHLNKIGESNKVTELKNALSALKLNEIEVDVSSTQVILLEEISLLRGAVDTEMKLIGPKDQKVTGSGGVELEKLQAMERENSSLRQLLLEAQKELKSSVSMGPPQPPMPNGGGDSLETLKLQKEVQSLREANKELNEKLEIQKSELNEKSESISKLSSQMDQLTKNNDVEKIYKTEIATLKKEIDQLKKQLSEVQRTSSATIQEMKSSNEAKIAEVEAKLDAEKEEMIEAMAQEVEEIEKNAKMQQESLVMENNQMKQRSGLQMQAIKNLSNRLQVLKENSMLLNKTVKVFEGQTQRELQDFSTSIKSFYGPSLITKLKDMNQAMKNTNQKYRREMLERKKLHNLVQELKGNIRVYLRCRPPTTKELEQFGDDAMCVSFPGPGEIKVFNEKNREKIWEFEEVFDIHTKQEQVYADVSQLVTSVLDGYNVCIFAYGQTGSGKTYTMSGPPDDRGVNTRALDELFSKANDRSTEWIDSISVSLLEVYNEDIHDLLLNDNSQTEKLEVKIGDYGNCVPGLSTIPVESIQQVFQLLAVADRNRSQTSTNMNEHSSRSHMMLTVTVISEYRATGLVTRGKLNLVDLAGSERINKSGATGQALKEAQNINKSLSALGDVIAARAEKKAHVPFRNSTLTYLLQDSLSSDSKTLMIVCISPVLYNSEETFCSLNFASRVRSVELGRATKQTMTAGSSKSSSSMPSSSSGMNAGSLQNRRQSTNGKY